MTEEINNQKLLPHHLHHHRLITQKREIGLNVSLHWICASGPGVDSTVRKNHPPNVLATFIGVGAFAHLQLFNIKSMNSHRKSIIPLKRHLRTREMLENDS
jgi:hypothetical protein